MSIYDQGADGEPDPTGEPGTGEGEPTPAEIDEGAAQPEPAEGNASSGPATVTVTEDAVPGENSRDYVILVSEDDQQTWSVFKTVNASSKEAARRSLTEDELIDGAHYREVPARSWGEATKASVQKITNISFS